ncbi:MurR/RpiR family transcriptional regulator [Roseomonas sp. AR75]|uniref:MurR/RpiR family transcriptional regulator n=1 Tax=Roseomonas sp. AR75 TaxID=2562311 RepID=UPI0010C13DDA|nr:MurR/RpiR family transcriptional regulator [Roseomonas sp. AR75]
MNAVVPLVKLIEDRAGDLSPAQRALARHVAGNYQAVAFSTVADLARAVGVSEATVVRFANALGFSGYPALQQEVRRMVRADLKGTDRLSRAAPPSTADGGALARVMRKEMENIARLPEMQDGAALAEAAGVLRGARRVLVVGARATAPLAFHLWFALDKLGLDVSRSLTADTEATDRLGRMDHRDAVVVIGFPRYLRALVAVLDFARRRGVRRVVVTDSPFSDLKGEIGLHVAAESASFVAFHAAPLILLNALIEEVAAADRAGALRALQDFEAVAEEHAYFQRS